MIADKAKLQEYYDNEFYQTRIVFFHVPLDLLEGRFPEAEEAELSLEFPLNKPDEHLAITMLSPVKDGSAYDYSGFFIPDEEIKKLLELAAQHWEMATNQVEDTSDVKKKPKHHDRSER